ncbi:MAG: NUDIX hydrolase [Armatimonadota bacterium]
MSSTRERLRVAGVILHRDGRVLLQHRDDRPDIVSPNLWVIFGGHLEPGEEPEAGARREIQEELGLSLEPPLELFHHDDDGNRERFFFAADLRVPIAELTLYEGQAMELLGPEEIRRYPLVPFHRELLLRFLGSNGT